MHFSGWVKTGNAFDFQPTFGDNAVYRPPSYESNITSYINVDSKHAESSGHAGRYYIGTFESRPGSDVDYRAPSSKFPAGSIQGDEPIGTLTSNTFIIGLGEINFLIGGGCNIESEVSVQNIIFCIQICLRLPFCFVAALARIRELL